MGYIPKFKVGDIISHKEMCEAYKIGNMGGMRKSNTYNCLVLISDSTKGTYEDEWHEGVLHYTGMGKRGDQVLKGNQNETLYYSRTNGVEIHLFEVEQPCEYTYRGIAKLTGDPYQGEQRDVDDNSRNVWIFPIKPIDDEPAITEEEFLKKQDTQKAKAEAMNMAELRALAMANSKRKRKKRKVTSTRIERDQHISEYTKRIANGKCTLCGEPAPFNDKEGKPYLETHHIIWLAKGGADSVYNTVALCPNCHRKMHIVNDSADVKRLKDAITKLLNKYTEE